MTFLSKISLLLMAKDLKLKKQLKHLFIYMPFQDEKPCQGQHCSSVAHLSFSFFLLKSSKGKKKLKKTKHTHTHKPKAVSTSTGDT